MSYCHECGTELGPESKFCNECGTEVDGGVAASTEESEPTTNPEEVGADGFSWKRGVAAGVMGLLIGVFLAWGTLNMGGIAGVLFFVGWISAGYYLYQKPTPLSAIGAGLYGTALVMVFTPILFYLSSFFSADANTAAGAGKAIGSLIGLVIWGFVFLVAAVVVFVIGYFVNRKAKSRMGAPAA